MGYTEITSHHTNEVKKYPIEITETLSRIIRMEASTPDEAVDKVKTLYRKGLVVLDSGDYVDTEFRAKGNKISKEDRQNGLIIIKNLCNSLSLEIEKNLNLPDCTKLLVSIEDLMISCKKYTEG